MVNHVLDHFIEYNHILKYPLCTIFRIQLLSNIDLKMNMKAIPEKNLEL